uniref:PNPLA domain-containing protein n=1 Tax=Oryzias sinensis TaxID=183150 RepID=A0A8C8A4J3_9TELE
MGIFDGALKGFQLSSLGGRTFHEPGNISIYFRSQNMVGFGENQECVAVAPQYLNRRQRHRHCGRSVTDQTMTNSEDVVQSLKSRAQTKNVETSSSVPDNSGQQLFHISSLTTRFGETYRYVANHINSQFSLVSARVQKQETFKTQWKHGKRKSQNISDLSHVKLNNVSSSWEEGYLLFARHINNYFGAKATYEAQKKGDKNLKEIKSYEKQCFCSQEKATVTLLRHRRTYKQDERLQAALRETCALIGLVDPLQSYGIRVLSIDGGGTRGVIPLEVLKMLEDKTGKKIHQLFDYICGVSTGAILAFMLGLARFSLEECADMYREISTKVFQQNRLVGTVKMGWSHSYYNTETWENILKKELGNRVLINTSRDQQSPKVSAVSAVVNWGASPKAFVFRNYNHKPGSLSRYTGSSGHQMWQAVRASSAAPGYFQEFTLESNIHQDGGIIMNNPCALAVHESRLLWPKHPFQCVLSLGTGRYDNTKRMPATSTSLKAKITNFISSATNTEGVHTLLDDLLAPNVYFRFNPMLSAEVALDENRPGALEQLQRDTQYYLERNQLKAAKLCLVLGRERSSAERAICWMKEKSWEVRHRLM